MNTIDTNTCLWMQVGVQGNPQVGSEALGINAATFDELLAQLRHDGDFAIVFPVATRCPDTRGEANIIVQRFLGAAGAYARQQHDRAALAAKAERELSVIWGGYRCHSFDECFGGDDD